MPETDILNPNPGYDPDLGNSMNPDYGFTHSRVSTLTKVKPPMGYEYARESSNAGHTFKLGWRNRPPAVIYRLKQYFEQYEDGFFTVIDHDGDGRHYVGHFTGEWPRVPNGFLRADVQLTFEEVPGAPMVEYPAEWDRDAVRFLINNDRGEQRINTSGTWAQTAHAGDPAYKTLDNDGTVVGQWAQIEYRGYGFRVKAIRNVGMGIFDVYLDGVKVGSLDGRGDANLGPNILFTWEAVPLDIHRVKLVATNTASLIHPPGVGINLHSFEVMR